MSLIMSKAKLGFAVLALNLIAGSHDAQAATCKPNISATGTSNFAFAAARTAARANWNVQAVGSYGPLYGSWIKASNRSINCTQSGKIRSCVYSGNPCF